MSKSSLILAIETSSRIGSVALACGDELLAETMFSSPLKHSAEIFPALSDLLDRFEQEPDQIKQVYISGGPGSFTGLRIAVTVAKAMHLATGVQIVSVDTLDVVAANVISLTDDDDADEMPRTASHERVGTIVDAKRGQFFVAVYERDQPGTNQRAGAGVWRKVVPDCLMRPEQFIEEFAGRGKDLWLLGDGLVYYKDKFQAEGVRFFDEQYWSPRAAKVHILGCQKATKGEFDDPLTLVPNYLRRPDAKVKSE